MRGDERLWFELYSYGVGVLGGILDVRLVVGFGGLVGF